MSLVHPQSGKFIRFLFFFRIFVSVIDILHKDVFLAMQQDMTYLMEECIPEIIFIFKLLGKLYTRNSIDVSCTSFYGCG